MLDTIKIQCHTSLYSCYGFLQEFINDCDVFNFTLIGLNNIISVSLLARYKAILLCTVATDFFRGL